VQLSAVVVRRRGAVLSMISTRVALLATGLCSSSIHISACSCSPFYVDCLLLESVLWFSFMSCRYPGYPCPVASWTICYLVDYTPSAVAIVSSPVQMSSRCPPDVLQMSSRCLQMPPCWVVNEQLFLRCCADVAQTNGCLTSALYLVIAGEYKRLEPMIQLII